MAKRKDKHTSKLFIDPSGQLDLLNKSYEQELKEQKRQHNEPVEKLSPADPFFPVYLFPGTYIFLPSHFSILSSLYRCVPRYLSYVVHHAE